jgi:LPXTG-motif cell wall-anchored protein
LTIPEIGMFNPIFIILGVICTLVGVLFYLGWKKKKSSH